jgi:hypothetical protein
MAPAQSPSHQVNHTEVKLLTSAWPARVRLLTPIVALANVEPRLIRGELGNASRRVEKLFTAPTSGEVARNQRFKSIAAGNGQ